MDVKLLLSYAVFVIYKLAVVKLSEAGLKCPSVRPSVRTYIRMYGTYLCKYVRTYIRPQNVSSI